MTYVFVKQYSSLQLSPLKSVPTFLQKASKKEQLTLVKHLACRRDWDVTVSPPLAWDWHEKKASEATKGLQQTQPLSHSSDLLIIIEYWYIWKCPSLLIY